MWPSVALLERRPALYWLGMRRLTLSLLALAALACDAEQAPQNQAPPAKAVPADTKAGAVDATPAKAEPDPEPELRPEPSDTITYRQPPLLESGLPAVSRGPAVRLPSIGLGIQRQGEREYPSVTLPKAEAQAALDEQLRAYAERGRCEVPLALESFVSLRCEVKGGTGQPDHEIAHFVIEDSGAVREVEVWSLFHPGEDERVMTRRLVHDAGAGARRIVVSERGVELSYPFDGEPEIDLLPWRSIAPYVRVDGPLGPPLLAAGLPLAPPETQLPLAPIVPALWANSEQALLKVWAKAPPLVRSGARLATPGGHTGFGLLFAPEVGAGDVAKLESAEVLRGVAYYTQLPPLLVHTKAREELQLREAPKQDAKLIETLAPPTELSSVDGLVRELDSTPGAEGWAYVVTEAGKAGWVRGEGLELLPIVP